MISLFSIVFIIALLAFAVSVPLNGYFTAALLRKIYDKRALYDEQTFYFFDYFDFVGTFAFLFLGFGWGGILPVHQGYITGPWRIARTVLAYLAQSLVSIGIALVAILGSLLLTGKGCVYTALNIFLTNALHQSTDDLVWQLFQQGSHSFAACSPHAVTATLFLTAIIYVQTAMLCICMVRNFFQAVLYPLQHRLLTHSYSWIITIAIPLLFCILFYRFFFALAVAFMIICIQLLSLCVGA